MILKSVFFILDQYFREKLLMYSASCCHGQISTTQTLINILRPLSILDLCRDIMHTCNYCQYSGVQPGSRLFHFHFFIFLLEMADKTLCFNTNTTLRDFVGGGSFSCFQRKCARLRIATNVISLEFPRGGREETGVNNTFSDSDAIRTVPHDNNFMVITVQRGN